MMVALIEDQIHQYLIDQEEQRCRAIEAKNNEDESTAGQKVKRRTIPKPWTRPSDAALCQDAELLIMVSQYDYDLSNEAFQNYCGARGMLHIAGEFGTRRWEYMADFRKTKSDYLGDPYFQVAEAMEGKHHRYSDEEMETGWKIMVLGRAKLQDCWELYRRESSTADT